MNPTMIVFHSTLVVRIAKIGPYASRMAWVNEAATEVGVTQVDFVQEDRFSTITFSANLDIGSDDGLPTEEDLNEILSAFFGRLVGELAPEDSWFCSAHPVERLPSASLGGRGPKNIASVLH